MSDFYESNRFSADLESFLTGRLSVAKVRKEKVDVSLRKFEVRQVFPELLVTENILIDGGRPVNNAFGLSP